MLDPKKLRQDFEGICEQLKHRGVDVDPTLFHELEEKRRVIQTKTQDMQATRNKRSKEIGMLKAKGEDISGVLKEMEALREQMQSHEHELNDVLAKQDALFASLPNLPDPSVPVGKDEDDNKMVKEWGTPKTFDFEPKDHVDLGEIHGGLDFASGAKLSGARFVVMKSDIAKLHRALAQFMMDVHTQEHGYTEVMVPMLVEDTALFGTGQLPKFAEDLFVIQGERKLSLIPTSEVPLANLVSQEIVAAEDLPLKFVCHSNCYRSEAGSYGKDTRGLIRQHQFEKVELVQITHPEKSFDALEEVVGQAQTILQKLELPYRMMTLCTGDMGFSAAKTYDLEVWLPAQNCYREISSCSNTLDFQARRMQARFKSSSDAKPELVHTLNGSGLAVGRTLVAVLENYQTENADIVVPEVLRPYMGGMEIIKAKVHKKTG